MRKGITLLAVGIALLVAYFWVNGSGYAQTISHWHWWYWALAAFVLLWIIRFFLTPSTIRSGVRFTDDRSTQAWKKSLMLVRRGFLWLQTAYKTVIMLLFAITGTMIYFIYRWHEISMNTYLQTGVAASPFNPNPIIAKESALVLTLMLLGSLALMGWANLALASSRTLELELRPHPPTGISGFILKAIGSAKDAWIGFFTVISSLFTFMQCFPIMPENEGVFWGVCALGIAVLGWGALSRSELNKTRIRAFLLTLLGVDLIVALFRGMVMHGTVSGTYFALGLAIAIVLGVLFGNMPQQIKNIVDKRKAIAQGRAEIRTAEQGANPNPAAGHDPAGHPAPAQQQDAHGSSGSGHAGGHSGGAHHHVSTGAILGVALVLLCIGIVMVHEYDKGDLYIPGLYNQPAARIKHENELKQAVMEELAMQQQGHRASNHEPKPSPGETADALQGPDFCEHPEKFDWDYAGEVLKAGTHELTTPDDDPVLPKQWIRLCVKADSPEVLNSLKIQIGDDPSQILLYVVDPDNPKFAAVMGQIPANYKGGSLKIETTDPNGAKVPAQVWFEHNAASLSSDAAAFLY